MLVYAIAQPRPEGFAIPAANLRLFLLLSVLHTICEYARNPKSQVLHSERVAVPVPPKPSPRSPPSPHPRSPSRSSTAPSPAAAFPNVDPAWLAKAIALLVLVALLCGYGTFCLLFFQGQWQLPLHPAVGNPLPPLIAGTLIEPVRFSPNLAGSPQLAGFWLPAARTPHPRNLTALFLPSGDGALSDPAQLSTVAALHNAGLHVFAFDYRGYGQSSGPHPNQRRMAEDTAAAFLYLTSLRHLPPSTILPYGNGVAASLALALAANENPDHPPIPAIILDNPDPDVLEHALADPRTHLLPVRLLFHERFNLLPALATLQTPKLILIRGPETGRARSKILETAANPKLIVDLPNPAPDLLRSTLTRFLDQYTAPPPLPSPPQTK